MYNALGIPTNRTIQRQGTTRNDAFTHNDRSELTAATMGANNYAYDYDNIGNRKTAQETTNEFTYESNALNQYTQITENDTDFTPEFDLDGNQTRIKTVTGIWTATYNALNRPVRFENEAAGIVITADYDYMGRRVFKKVETNNTVTTHLRFLYRGYLQIAALDLTRATQNAMWLITWDPTEPVATRPLAVQQSGTWYTYGIDLPKNITELYGTNGYIVTAYTYSPYGLVTSTGSVTQHLQWSSEYTDTDLGLVYYNYRHYNPLDGRWQGRDVVGIEGGLNTYGFVMNTPSQKADYIGCVQLLSEREVHREYTISSGTFSCTCGTKSEKSISVSSALALSLNLSLKEIITFAWEWAFKSSSTYTVTCDLTNKTNKKGAPQGKRTIEYSFILEWDEEIRVTRDYIPHLQTLYLEPQLITTTNIKRIEITPYQSIIEPDTSNNCCDK